MMARSSSVRRWLEELRYETESYEPHQQQDAGPIAWRYARVTWSPETVIQAQIAENAVQTVQTSSPNVDTSATSKVREVVAKKEEGLQSEEPEMRDRLKTVSIAPGLVNTRRQNFVPLKVKQSPSPELQFRRKLNSDLQISPRPLSHQTPKLPTYLHREHSQLSIQRLPSIIKEGPISKVKLMASGLNKTQKHWKSGMYAVLSERAICFAENEQTLQLMKSGNLSGELLVRVWLSDGARIMQDVDRLYSNKRNVLAIYLPDGTPAVLIQNDDPQLSDAWFREISKVIAKYADVDSGMQSSPGGNNTRSKLNWFFKKRPNKETLVNQGIYKNEPIFGNTLERLYETSDKRISVPAFVLRCMEMLENHPHVISSGLYRASGNLSHIQKLRLQVDQQDAEALEDTSVALETDVLAGALKLFFRELQIPLIPYNIYLLLSNAITDPDPGRRLTQSKEALRKLPLPHYDTLSKLCQHLLRITEHEQKNQMSAANLAIVWGPSFTWPDEGAGTRALYLCSDVNRVVQYLIEENGKLFK